MIAHELTHVAHPSPVARFFDDVDDSPEERQAERVARVMAASPVAPTASTLLPQRRDASVPATPDVIRRSPAQSGGPLSAAALAASITGMSEPSVQRWGGALPGGRRPMLGGHRAGAQTPAPEPKPEPPPKSEPAAAPPPAAAQSTVETEYRLPESGDDTDEWLIKQLERNIDRLAYLLEDRIVAELERRGGRIWRHV